MNAVIAKMAEHVWLCLDNSSRFLSTTTMLCSVVVPQYSAVPECY